MTLSTQFVCIHIIIITIIDNEEWSRASLELNYYDYYCVLCALCARVQSTCTTSSLHTLHTQKETTKLTKTRETMCVCIVWVRVCAVSKNRLLPNDRILSMCTIYTMWWLEASGWLAWPYCCYTPKTYNYDDALVLCTLSSSWWFYVFRKFTGKMFTIEFTVAGAQKMNFGCFCLLRCHQTARDEQRAIGGIEGEEGRDRETTDGTA